MRSKKKNPGRTYANYFKLIKYGWAEHALLVDGLLQHFLAISLDHVCNMNLQGRVQKPFMGTFQADLAKPGRQSQESR